MSLLLVAFDGVHCLCSGGAWLGAKLVAAGVIWLGSEPDVFLARAQLVLASLSLLPGSVALVLMLPLVLSLGLDLGLSLENLPESVDHVESDLLGRCVENLDGDGGDDLPWNGALVLFVEGLLDSSEHSCELLPLFGVVLGVERLGRSCLLESASLSLRNSCGTRKAGLSRCYSELIWLGLAALIVNCESLGSVDPSLVLTLAIVGNGSLVVDLELVVLGTVGMLLQNTAANSAFWPCEK